MALRWLAVSLFVHNCTESQWGDYREIYSFLHFYQNPLKVLQLVRMHVPNGAASRNIENKKTKSRFKSSIQNRKEFHSCSCNEHFRCFYLHPLRFILFTIFSLFFGHRRLVLPTSNIFNSFFSARRCYYIWSGFEPNTEQKKRTRIVGERNASHAYSTQRIVILNASLYIRRQRHWHNTQRKRKRGRHMFESIRRRQSERDNRIYAAAHPSTRRCMCSGHVFTMSHLMMSLSIAQVCRLR